MTAVNSEESLSRDAVGGVDDLTFTGVRDGNVDAAGCAAKVLSGLGDSHSVTDGPNLVASGSVLNHAAHAAGYTRVVAGHRSCSINGQLH